MKTKSLSLMLFILLATGSAYAQEQAAESSGGGLSAGFSSITNFIKKPFVGIPKEELIVTQGDPVEQCLGTAKKATQECSSPTSDTFKQGAQLLTTIPAIATTFLAGGDADEMSDMCRLTALSGLLSGFLNSGQAKTCQTASQACNESCNAATKRLSEAFKETNDGLEMRKIEKAIADVKETKEKCIQSVEQQVQQAQQQQLANALPIAGAEACVAGIDDSPSEEIVDCNLTRFQFYPECSPVSKLDTIATNFEPGVSLNNDPPEIDIPDVDDREDYWNNLRNQGANAGGLGGGGAGALGGSAGGGSGSSANDRSGGGGRRKSGSTILSGGTESSGSNSGWNTGDSDFDKKYAKLKAKNKNLKMLTPKKLGGRGLASNEFALASDDIWTRVYLRTNTRCTKQLTDCNANRSQNPYGIKN